MGVINEEQFKQGIEKRPEGGPSFMGAVRDCLPTTGGIDAEEAKKKLLPKLKDFGVEDKNAKTKISQALNNLIRDGRAGRTYFNGVAYFKRTEKKKEEKAAVPATPTAPAAPGAQ